MHAGRHEPLIEAEVFDAAQALMKERGEDWRKRRTNSSVYLLSGRITCAKCGSRFTGNAAHGRNARFRYYTCTYRLRYGKAQCDAETLPAELLDQAVIDALLRT